MVFQAYLIYTVRPNYHLRISADATPEDRRCAVFGQRQFPEQIEGHTENDRSVWEENSIRVNDKGIAIEDYIDSDSERKTELEQEGKACTFFCGTSDYKTGESTSETASEETLESFEEGPEPRVSLTDPREERNENLSAT